MDGANREHNGPSGFIPKHLFQLMHAPRVSGLLPEIPLNVRGHHGNSVSACVSQPHELERRHGGDVGHG